MSSPLATWDPSNDTIFVQPTPGEGRLEITDTCVYLIQENVRAFVLVWPEPTTWQPEEQTITFVSPIYPNEVVTLKHGDVIGPGGAGDKPPYIIPYVRLPHPECEGDRVIVNEVNVIQQDWR